MDETAGEQLLPFASTDEIEKYGSISSDFFRLLGLGNVLFISNDSCLSEIVAATAPDLTMNAVYERIKEAYEVDVFGLDRLVDIFARIQNGPAYQNWLKDGSP
jgi:hypothetical protein